MKRKLRKIKRKLLNSNLLLTVSSILIIISIIMIVFTIRFIISSNNDYNKLIDESKNINNNLNIDKFNKEYIILLKNNDITKTKANKVLEEAMEKYSIEYTETLEKTMNSIKDEQYSNLLTTTNYQNDFNNSINYISNKQKELITLENNLDKITEKSYYNVYIKDLTKNKNLINKYDVLINNIINKDEIDFLLYDIDKVKEILDISNDVLNYLNSNKSSWYIENNEIVFTNQDIKNNYESKVSQIKR